MTASAPTVSPASVDMLLQQMVRFDTVNGALSGRACAEEALSEWLASIARDWGFATRRLPVAGGCHNLLVTHEAGAGRPWLLFDSHLDTVSAEGMSIDPFSGELRDGKLFGRGSCDTKGTGAAMLWALRDYAASATQPNNVAILFSVDEEVGMTGIESFIANDLPALGFAVRGAIVGEPTELHPVVAHNGTLRWKLIAHGQAAHSSVPHEGRSAISMMVRAVQAIEDVYIASLDAEHRLTGAAACSINVIQGGRGVNVIPDRCEVHIDRRIVPREDAGPIMDIVLDLVNSLGLDAPDDYLGPLPGPAFTQEKLIYHYPLTDALNGELLAAAKAALGRLRLPKLHLGAPFGTHAGFLANAGVPAIVLGPGDVSRAHQASEWIDLDQLYKGVALYRELMAGPLPDATLPG